MNNLFPLLIAVVSFVLFFFLAWKNQTEDNIFFSDKPPHIVFIIADDLGFNGVGFNAAGYRTPNIDQLASEGIKLGRYYTQHLCTPSRSSLLTGRYPIRYGLSHWVIRAHQPSGLHLNETTLPQKLKQFGYKTHAVGKWHLGFFKWDYTPTRRGFDSFYGYWSAESDYYEHTVDGGYDFRNNTDVVKNITGIYSTYLFNDEAIRIINDYKANGEQQPLFLYYSFQNSHSPLQAPNKYISMCSHILSTNHKLFCAVTLAMDEAIGNLTTALKQNGLWENTLLIFSNDNGGDPNESGYNYPLRGAKFGYFEGGVRGVSFITGKGIPSNLKGTTNNSLFHLTDWFPTLLHVAKGSNDDAGFPLDGVNQWETLISNSPSKRNEILINIDPIENNSAIIVGDWKLIVGPQHYSSYYPPPALQNSNIAIPFFLEPHNISLFNLKHDPYEMNELSEFHPEKVQELLSRINSYSHDMQPPFFPPKDLEEADPKNFEGIWQPWK